MIAREFSHRLLMGMNIPDAFFGSVRAKISMLDREYSVNMWRTEHINNISLLSYCFLYVVFLEDKRDNQN